MKTDKTTVIGFILLGILFIGFFWVTNKQQAAQQLLQKHKQDSLALIEASKSKPLDIKDSLRQDSLEKTAVAGDFANAGVGTEQLTVLENDLMKVTFSNKGGQIKSVLLKHYKSYNNTNAPVLIGGGDNDQLGYSINTSAKTTAQTNDLYFTPSAPVKNADGSQTLTYRLASANGESITHQFVIRNNQYMINWDVSLTGAGQLLTQSLLNMHWNTQLHQQQKDPDYEKDQSRICYWQNNSFDFNRAKRDGLVAKDFAEPIQWLSFKQQFFNVTVASPKNQFRAGKAQMQSLNDSTHQLFDASADMQIQLPATSRVDIPFNLYFGPNDYHILKQYDNGMVNIVDLGTGIFSFVKYINRGVIIPVFNFFAGFITSFGWVIALLTLVIRIIISPLTYSSYLSGAKMKVLKPELDELKKKYGSDQQGYAMEQMKLFREAGVNPLGGCIPAILQIPIFFALYSFFGSNIDLRGQSFLWAQDLTTYDTILHFGINIPLLGDHLSLFTVTTTITSFLISVYNMSSTPTQGNPAMKYMPYIMPIVLLFWFNKLPSALTWYYTVSNLVTLLIQLFIQKVIIKPEKVLAAIELKRKNPKAKSKFQIRMEQMTEMQKKMQEAKDRGKK